MAELDCEILTPEGRVFEGRVEMVVVPGAEGELGVLPRHAPIIARLKVGEVRVKLEGGEWRSWAISEGYFKMQFDKATVLVEDAVAATDIDVEQARADAEARRPASPRPRAATRTWTGSGPSATCCTRRTASRIAGR